MAIKPFFILRPSLNNQVVSHLHNFFNLSFITPSRNTTSPTDKMNTDVDCSAKCHFVTQVAISLKKPLDDRNANLRPVEKFCFVQFGNHLPKIQCSTSNLWKLPVNDEQSCFKLITSLGVRNKDTRQRYKLLFASHFIRPYGGPEWFQTYFPVQKSPWIIPYSSSYSLCVSSAAAKSWSFSKIWRLLSRIVGKFLTVSSSIV